MYYNVTWKSDIFICCYYIDKNSQLKTCFVPIDVLSVVKSLMVTASVPILQRDPVMSCQRRWNDEWLSRSCASCGGDLLGALHYEKVELRNIHFYPLVIAKEREHGTHMTYVGFTNILQNVHGPSGIKFCFGARIWNSHMRNLQTDHWRYMVWTPYAYNSNDFTPKHSMNFLKYPLIIQISRKVSSKSFYWLLVLFLITDLE